MADNTFGNARARFESSEPVEMSDNVRRLAKKVLAQRRDRQSREETPEQWAKRITDCIYGPD